MKQLRTTAIIFLVITIAASSLFGQTRKNVAQLGHWTQGQCQAIAVGQYGYIGNDSLFMILDISKPATPAPISSLKLPDRIEDIFVINDRAYVALGFSGVQILNITNPTAPALMGKYQGAEEPAFGVWVQNNYAYVAAGYNGLKIIDASYPQNPTPIGTAQIQGEAFKVQVIDNLAYVACSWGGLRIYDVSSPSAPYELGFTYGLGDANDVKVVGQYAYVANFGNGLRIYDIGASQVPQEVGYFEVMHDARAVDVSGNLAYVASGDTGLFVLDVSKPYAPIEIGYFDTGNQAHDVAVAQDKIYVADNQGGLYVVRLEAELELSAQTLDFGMSLINQPAIDTLRIRNIGNTALQVDSTKILGVNPSDFAIISGGGNQAAFTIQPADSEVVVFEFRPASQGVKTAFYLIYGNSQTTPDTVRLTGHGRSQYWTIYNTSNSGLPDNWVHCIAVDAMGQKWIGTNNGGLAQFDNSNWTSYNTSNSGLPNNDVRAILIEENGNQWLGTFGGGLARWNAAGWTIFNSTNSGLPSNQVVSIAMDDSGRQWIGTFGGGLARFDGTNWRVYNQSNSNLPNSDIICIANDKGSTKWLGTHAGLVRFDGLTWTTYDTANSDLPDQEVRDIAIDEQGRKWIATFGGLALLDGSNWTIFTAANSPLPSNRIMTVDIDGGGNVWIGTDGGGLALFDHGNWSVFNPINSGLPNERVRAFEIENGIDKWIGTYDGGLARYTEPIGTVIPRLLISKPILNFPNAAVGDSSQQDLELINKGNANLVVQGLTITGPATSDFAIVHGGGAATMIPNERRHLFLRFLPKVPGNKTARLIITSNAETSPDTVILNAIAPGARIAVNPVAITFSPTLVGGARVDSIKIKNSGASRLDFGPMHISGNDARQFQADTLSTFSLMPGDSLFYKIRFAPSTGGNKIARLNIPSNDRDTTVALSGLALAPKLWVSQNYLAFGNVNLAYPKVDSIRIKNVGSANLGVGPITITGAQASKFSVNTSAFSLLPGDSASLKVTFRADSIQNCNATLNIVSNGGDTTVALTGTGAAPKILVTPLNVYFQQVLINRAKTDTVSIRNIGNIDLHTTRIRLVGTDAPRFNVDTTRFTLAPGQIKKLPVRFTPNRLDTFVVTLRIETDGGNEGIALIGVGVAPLMTIWPTTVSFGTLSLGDNSIRQVKIRNVGQAPLTIFQQEISGVAANAFSILGITGNQPVAPADSLIYSLRFSPSTAGSKSAFLVITSNAPSSPDSVHLTGTGIQAAIQVEHDSTVAAGDSLHFNITTGSGFVPTVKRLYYRQAGEINWHYIELMTTGNNYQTMIPPDSVTYRGVEYYVYLSDGQNVVTYPPVDAQNHPAVIRVAVEQMLAPMTLPPVRYKMISIPLELQQPDLLRVLADDYGPHDVKKWRLLRWRQVDSSYVEFPLLQDRFEAGRAFWLITRDGHPFDVENGLSIDSSLPFRMTVQPGWNQVGNPFPFPIAADSVETGGLVEPPVYYDGRDYRYNVEILEPWEGYFVYNTQ
ncbi:MAG: choice-of-anchor D domain-containing protein, partial [candidate division KSB1 bacterium]|nr:choice-of-anchor D domain-containing protein [candidate division KSB1 bacterium]